jgi:hypothetical protein
MASWKLYSSNPFACGEFVFADMGPMSSCDALVTETVGCLLVTRSSGLFLGMLDKFLEITKVHKSLLDRHVLEL